jgi:hypothetical protein
MENGIDATTDTIFPGIAPPAVVLRVLRDGQTRSARRAERNELW